MFNTIQLNSVQEDLIRQAALTAYPNEMCGLLTQNSFAECKNVSTDPTKGFAFNPLEFAQYFPKAIAVVHSHCRASNKPEIFDLRTPSYSDLIGQKRSAKPWLIVGTEGMSVTDPLQIPRIPSNQYLGRRFLWFINDCYSLVQDWYKFELGIELPDHQAKEDYRDLRNFSNLFTDYIQSYGFTEISLGEITRGDLLLLDNAGFEDNHLGIFTGTSVIHQDMISTEVPFETFIGRIKKVLRYVG